MFSRIYSPIILSLNSRRSLAIRCTHRRSHSIISTHTSFPATLLRLNAGSTFKPFSFERQSNELSINDAHEQTTESDESGDAWTNCIALNRATLMPNTFMMQEIIRTATDNYLENKENSMSIERPFIFTVPKGTILPNTLRLLRETPFQFSLVPSGDVTVSVLDNILYEFYSKYAEKQDVLEWLTDHKYEDAIAAENEKEWLAR